MTRNLITKQKTRWYNLRPTCHLVIGPPNLIRPRNSARILLKWLWAVLQDCEQSSPRLLNRSDGRPSHLRVPTVTCTGNSRSLEWPLTSDQWPPTTVTVTVTVTMISASSESVISWLHRAATGPLGLLISWQKSDAKAMSYPMKQNRWVKYHDWDLRIENLMRIENLRIVDWETKLINWWLQLRRPLKFESKIYGIRDWNLTHTPDCESIKLSELVSPVRLIKIISLRIPAWEMQDWVLYPLAEMFVSFSSRVLLHWSQLLN